MVVATAVEIETQQVPQQQQQLKQQRRERQSPSLRVQLVQV
jgi:hypothetical protein